METKKIDWKEEGVKYNLIDLHDIEMELKCVSWNNEYLENGIEFYIEYKRGVKYRNDAERHCIKN